MGRTPETISSEDLVHNLLEVNKLLDSMMNGATDAVYAKDRQGRYISINKAGAEYFGRSVAEVIGKTDTELLGKELVDKYVEFDKKLFATGKPVTYESRTTFGVGHAYFSTTKSPLRDSDGNIVGLVGISRDVTTARLSEEKYRFIFDNAPLSFWEEDFSDVKIFLDDLKAKGVTDLRKYFKQKPDELEACIDLIKVENVNRTTLDMYRVVNKTEFIKRMHRNFTPESESIFLDEFVALSEGQTYFQAEGSFVNLNGDTLDVLFNLNVLPGHEEDLSLILVSIIDLTDTNQLTSELNSMKHRYQSIVEAQTEMICRVDPAGKIMFRNTAFTRFFEFKDIGKNMKFIMLFPPDELEKCSVKIQELTASSPSGKCEFRNYDKDDNFVWQEWSVTAFFGKSGILLGYQAVGADVTTRKLAQDALSASEERWRSVINNANDLIMTVNSDGCIISINDYSELPKDQKWAGRTLHEVFEERNAKPAMELVNKVFSSGSVVKTEFRLESQTAGTVIYGVTLSPIFSGTRVITVICIARNITEMKELEKRTKEALFEGQENERRRVSQELHDGIGQLFTAMKLNIQHLKTGMTKNSSEDVLESITELDKNIDVALTEVKNISRNLMPDVLWQFGLQPAMEDMVDKWNSTFDGVITLDMVDMEHRFSADVEQALFRMSQELVNNSIRHGNAENIYVQLINHGNSIVLMVEDEGCGYDPEKTQKGLGLRNIGSRADVFEGTVEIDAAPGRGTVTTVEIPLTHQNRT